MEAEWIQMEAIPEAEFLHFAHLNISIFLSIEQYSLCFHAGTVLVNWDARKTRNTTLSVDLSALEHYLGHGQVEIYKA
jgi:hypothetical protein